MSQSQAQNMNVYGEDGKRKRQTQCRPVTVTKSAAVEEVAVAKTKTIKSRDCFSIFHPNE